MAQLYSIRDTWPDRRSAPRDEHQTWASEERPRTRPSSWAAGTRHSCSGWEEH